VKVIGKYYRLNLEDREEISRSLASGRSFCQIATDLNRNKSTISREVNRTRKLNRHNYRAVLAQRRSHRSARKRHSGQYKLSKNPKLWIVIEGLLRKRWSPEQIVMRLQKEYPRDKSMRVSHETIYSYLYVFAKGSLKKKLIACLRRNHKRRYKKGLRRVEFPCFSGHLKKGTMMLPREVFHDKKRPKEIQP